MGTARCPANGYPITFGNQILNGEAKIGERIPEGDDDFPGKNVGPMNIPITLMGNDARIKQCIDDVQVALVNSFNPTPNQYLAVHERVLHRAV